MVGPWSGIRPRPTLILPSDIRTGDVYSGFVLNSATINLKFEPVCNKSYQFGTNITFDNLCNINTCNIKYDGDCISGLAFVRGTLFDPASVVYRDITRQSKGL
jgi:hypothetical protein